VEVARFLSQPKAPFLLALIFVTMLITGLMLSGFGHVMANGIVICLDCIGLI